MDRIAVAVVLAVLSGSTAVYAFLSAPSYARHRFWMLLIGASLPLALAAMLALFGDAIAPRQTGHPFNRGFGPDWTCAASPRANICFRKP